MLGTALYVQQAVLTSGRCPSRLRLVSWDCFRVSAFRFHVQVQLSKRPLTELSNTVRALWMLVLAPLRLYRYVRRAGAPSLSFRSTRVTLTLTAAYNTSSRLACR